MLPPCCQCCPSLRYLNQPPLQFSPIPIKYSSKHPYRTSKTNKKNHSIYKLQAKKIVPGLEHKISFPSSTNTQTNGAPPMCQSHHKSLAAYLTEFSTIKQRKNHYIVAESSSEPDSKKGFSKITKKL